MTPSLRRPGRFIPGLVGLGIMLVLVLLVSGCTQQAATPATTPQLSATTPVPAGMTTTPMAEAGKKMVTFTEADNGTTGSIAQNTRFAIQLEENPTTGYTWDATLSAGLELESSDYRENEAPTDMVGVGGIRTWVILAKDTGEQTFSASYRRSWEAVTGDETAYSMTINVEKM